MAEKRTVILWGRLFSLSEPADMATRRRATDFVQTALNNLATIPFANFMAAVPPEAKPKSSS